MTTILRSLLILLGTAGCSGAESAATLAASAVAPTAAPTAYHCWSDPGFAGVMRIDLANQRVCNTGIGGQVYECKADASLPIVRTTTFVMGSVAVEEFVACTKNESGHCDADKVVALKIYKQSTPRPSFPEQTVFQADHFSTWTGAGGDPYPSAVAASPLKAELEDGDFMCLPMP